MTTEAQTVEQTALTTAEQMLPVLLAAIAQGVAASTPQAAVIAMVAEILPPLIESFGANSAQIKQLMTTLVTEVNAGQQQIDATAKERGIVVPDASGTPAA